MGTAVCCKAPAVIELCFISLLTVQSKLWGASFPCRKQRNDEGEKKKKGKAKPTCFLFLFPPPPALLYFFSVPQLFGSSCNLSRNTSAGSAAFGSPGI